jgi:hypothetical protein
MPATDEDIVRDLLHRYASHARPPASIATEVVARQRRREFRRRIVSVAVTGAALGTAAGVIAVAPGHSSPAPGGPAASGGTGPTIQLTADQRELYHLSSLAAKQPQGHGRYAVMSTAGTDVKDTSVIDTRTGNMWSYQEGSDGTPSGKGFTPHYSPTAARLAAMPTSLPALRAALIAQWKQQTQATPSPVEKTGPVPIARPVPESKDDMVFQQATYLLWNPLVSPSLRSALYKVLAAVPGVTVTPSAHDSTGRSAVELSRTDTGGLPNGKSDRQVYATYESPVTGAVLESVITYPPGSDIVTPQNPHGNGTVVDTTVYLSVTWAGSVPPNPYAS